MHFSCVRGTEYLKYFDPSFHLCASRRLSSQASNDFPIGESPHFEEFVGLSRYLAFLRTITEDRDRASGLPSYLPLIDAAGYNTLVERGDRCWSVDLSATSSFPCRVDL